MRISFNYSGKKSFISFDMICFGIQDSALSYLTHLSMNIIKIALIFSKRIVLIQFPIGTEFILISHINSINTSFN